MARKALDINIRIERQEKKIMQLSQQLEEAKDQYDKLIQEKKKEDETKLLEAYRKTDADVLDWLWKKRYNRNTSMQGEIKRLIREEIEREKMQKNPSVYTDGKSIVF